jgi:predicted dehydrogenase
MNVGIIGCGLIGQKRADSIKGARLVACVDTDINKAEKFAKKNGDIPFFKDAQELLGNDNLDIVIICTPHAQLPMIIKSAVAFKKHVLVEKPGAKFAEDLLDIETFAKKNNVKVRVGFNHRYHRTFRRANEIIESREMGNIYFIRARYGHGGRIGYNKEWRADPVISGGGELIDQGSHLIDLSRMIFGDFERVEGYARNYFWDMPVDDNAFLTLTTSKKQIAFLQVSCTEWKNMFSFEIYGEYGKIDINGLGGSYGTERIAFYKMRPEMGPPDTTIWEYPMSDDSWEVEFQEFLNDIQLNRTPSPGLSDAIENLRIINKIYKNSGYDYNA